MRVALLVGISGHTGKALMDAVLSNRHFKTLIVLTRRENRRLKNIHLKKVMIDFDEIDTYKEEFSGVDDVFCLLGTDYISTHKLDDAKMFEYEYPLRMAQTAKECGVKNFFLLNPANARIESNQEKLRLRAKLELEIKRLSFDNFFVFKVNGITEPVNTNSGLFVARRGFRSIMNIVGMGLFHKVRPTPANLVANKMIEVALSNPLDKKEFLPQDF